MNSNPKSSEDTGIVAEVRRVKQQLFEACGRDIHRMFEQLRSEQATSGHTIIPRVGRIQPPYREKALA